MQPLVSPSLILRVIAAVSLVVVAALLRVWPLQNMGTNLAYITYFPAVTIAAIYGGRVSGVLATILSLIVVYFWQSMSNSNFGTVAELEGVAIFLFTGLSLSVLSELMFRARVTAAQASELASHEKLRLDESERARLQLASSEYRFRQLFDNSPTGMIAVDPHSFRFLQANAKAQQMYGYSETELQGKTVADVTHPDDLAQSNQFNARLSEGSIDRHSVEKRYLRKDGSFFWAQSEITGIRNTLGSVELFVGNFIDISERKHAESVLKQSEERFRRMFENAPLPLGLVNADLQIVALNKRFIKVFGYTHDEIPTLDAWSKRAYPDEEYRAWGRKAWNESVASAVENGTDVEGREYTVTCKDGSTRIMLISGIVMEEGILATFFDVTERKQHEMELLQSKSKLQGALASMSDAVYISDAQGHFVDFNDAFATFHKFKSKEESPAKVDEYPKFVDVYEPGGEFVPLEQRPVPRALRGESASNAEYTLRRKDTGETWLGSYSYAPIRNMDGEIVGSVVAARDVTESKKAHEQVLMLSQAVEQSPSSIVITDLQANILYANAAFATNTGYALSEVIGKNPKFLHSGLTPRQSYVDMWEHLVRGESWQGEFINRRKDGTDYYESVLISPVRDINGEPISYLAIKEDITDQKLAEERMANLAHFDQLTGLPNRTLLQDHFRYALSLAQRTRDRLAILFLDLDNFKNVNDALGHSIGDELLMQVSVRLRSAIREGDTVARLGGDEFIFILSGTDANGAANIAEKLLKVISAPYQINNNELSPTASVGISIYPEDGTDIETLSRNADAAMYRAKQEGRNDFRFYTEAMQINSARNLKLGNHLRQAISRDQLFLNYQPQISLQDGRLVGAEALLRWHHPELGMISPAEFIPIAEETGLIIPIGEWVIRTAARQMKLWLDKGYTSMVMAVNLSAVQFRHAKLLQLVTGILEEVGLPPNHLELELTEAVAMNEPLKAIAIMDSLHEQGIRMSIDDFGTGYSSLSYLKRFKVSKLKIDQSFVRDITDDPEDKAIVTSIINLASSLGLQTIAEGVETASQLAFLRLQGCNEVQGYYFSKPLPVAEFEAFVSQMH